MVNAATPCGWAGNVGAELLSQTPCPPSLSPQYTVTVGFSPPVAVTLPLRVAVVVVTEVAGLVVMVGGAMTAEVIKLCVTPQLVPPELVALAEK